MIDIYLAKVHYAFCYTIYDDCLLNNFFEICHRFRDAVYSVSRGYVFVLAVFVDAKLVRFFGAALPSA